MNIIARPDRRLAFLDIETVGTEAVEKAALSAVTGRVVCVGLMFDDGKELVEHNLVDADEASILRRFWALVRASDCFVGHNIAQFDLMFLRQRSWVKGIKPSRRIDLRRFYTTDLIDSQMVFSNWGMTPYQSLDRLAALFDIGAKTGHGNEVQEWWTQGDLYKIGSYCQSDVRLSYKLFRRLMFQDLPPRFAKLPPLSQVVEHTIAATQSPANPIVNPG